MECLGPITIKNRNGGLNHVPCSRCEACLQRRRADWTFRLQKEQKASNTSHFVTLTYAEEYVPLNDNLDKTLVKEHLQKFIKRLRKYQEKEIKWKIKYYAVGEYGGKFGRPHYHLILFNCTENTIENLNRIWYNPKTKESLGLTYTGTVEAASVHYVTGYVLMNLEDYEGKQKPFSLMSKGLGKQYLYDNWRYHKQLDENGDQIFTVRNNGKLQYIPRYYKDKLFGIKAKEKQSEKIINILDENTRIKQSHFKAIGKDYIKAEQNNREKFVNEVRRRAKVNGERKHLNKEFISNKDLKENESF